MAAFTYKAIDSWGKVSTGEIEAQNKLDAYRQIEAKELQPVTVVAAGESAGSVRLSKARAASDGITGKTVLSRAQIILFTEEMADLVEAGLQLDQALRVMQERQEHPALKQVSMALRDELRDGTAMSVALRKVSPSFDDLFCNMVAAGELSGSLPQILRRLVANLTMIQELQSRVVSALIYPAFMGGAGFTLIAIFMTVLVPQLVNLFKKTGKQLPMMTQLLIDFSEFTKHTWWIGLIGVIGASVGFKAWVSQPAGRLAWDSAKLRLPLVGDVLQTRFYTQFAQTLSNLLFNGVPLLSGLRLMGKATTNLFLRALVERIVLLVGEGAAFSTALRQAGTFPAVFVDIVSVGEQTGKTAAALEKAGNRYDKELNKKIDRLTTLIQPLIIIVMAVIVSFVAYSIIAGIFQSASGLRAHR